MNSQKEIFALTDYKGNFGSKHEDTPYRSGMDKSKLIHYFKEANTNLIFIPFSEIDFSKNNYKDSYYIYTSSEDPNYYYKNYIEDVVYALQLAGAYVIPDSNFLRANNNKVFMEYLRRIVLPEEFCKLKTYPLGTKEEILNYIDQISFPIVIKASQGASGTNVNLAVDKKDLIKKVKKVSKTFNLKDYMWELARAYLHKGYIKNSTYRKKYIVQEFIPNLQKDWKVLIFGKRYFVLTRYNRKNDFRASGSKTNYKAGSQAENTYKILNFAQQIFKHLKIPHVSLDIAFDGDKYYLIEMQGIYFGTSVINISDVYYENVNDQWQPIPMKIDLEKIYSDSIVNFLNL